MGPKSRSAPVSRPTRSKMGCSYLTDRLMVASLAPARRSVALGTLPSPPLRPCRDKGVQPQFDLVERGGGGGEHCVEHRIDDVSLAPSRRKIGGEHRWQRDSLVVQRQQVGARNEDLNLHGPQAVPGLFVPRPELEIAAKRKDDGLSVSVEGPRRAAVASAPQSA